MSKYKEALKEIDRQLNKLDYKASVDVINSIKDTINDLKHCPECNGWIDFDDNFCSKCGAKLKGDD